MIISHRSIDESGKNILRSDKQILIETSSQNFSVGDEFGRYVEMECMGDLRRIETGMQLCNVRSTRIVKSQGRIRDSYWNES